MTGRGVFMDDRSGSSPNFPPDAIHLVSGLVYQVLQPGEGERPGPRDLVQVSYRAWTDTGELVADTSLSPTPTTLPVAAMSPGLAEALQLVTVGGRIRAWVPPHLTTAGDPAAERTTIYEVELHELIRTEDPLSIAPDLRSPRLD
ncbi:MAG: FKBP-type peptidyl-prolyl cis-trans isomerase [Pseudonocardiaceae bacterium]